MLIPILNNYNQEIPNFNSVLHIQDSFTKKHIPVGGIKIDKTYVQAVRFQTGPLFFIDIGSKEKIFINQASKVLISTLLNSSSSTTIFIVLEDYKKQKAVLKKEIVPILFEDVFYGELIEVDTYGAYKLCIIAEENVKRIKISLV
ncbi:hypothetical protein SAMN04488516_11743 [Desulfonauticus submarinus]|uniref:Uncharacterized protein n=1 Tax=Desulfonauticus submarinus TaxID=206665 RepID=A0A1H0GCG0_9BACT|nr:hypothetical protein [Desulfonauticus submarinus]SDO04550.1 hypothetical protein SAMN04488516_11743 [Desulfonauticus submarinus]